MSGLNIGIYCRVSSRDQAINGYGIDVQKNKINEYIKLYDVDYDNIEYYIDDGISGKNLERPQVKRLIDDVKNGKINCVYIYKLDRISRSVIDLYQILNTMIEHNCNLVAIMDNLDISTANGRFVVGILVLVSQLEREVDYERTRDAIDEMVECNKYPYGSRPFGYDKNEDLTLRLNKKEAIIIKKIFDLACAGVTIKEIQKELLEENKYRLSTDRIKEIILKPWYQGIFLYRGKEYDSIIPKIIDNEQANKAQLMISKRFKNYDSTKYYFSNKILCNCGNLCTNESTTKKRNNVVKHYYYYYCPNCKKRINQDYIIEQSIYSIIANGKEKKSKTNKAKMIKKLERLNSKIEEIYGNYTLDRIELSTYAISIQRLEWEKKEQIAKLKTIKFEDYIKWNEFDDLERRKFISNHIKRITVNLDAKMIVKKEYLDYKK